METGELKATNELPVDEITDLITGINNNKRVGRGQFNGPNHLVYLIEDQDGSGRYNIIIRIIPKSRNVEITYDKPITDNAVRTMGHAAYNKTEEENELDDIAQGAGFRNSEVYSSIHPHRLGVRKGISKEVPFDSDLLKNISEAIEFFKSTHIPLKLLYPDSKHPHTSPISTYIL